MIKVLLTLMLVSFQIQECTKGCLSCFTSASISSSSCEICDFFNNYMQTVAGNCKKMEIEHCLKYNYSSSFPDKCILCSSSYYFSIIDNKCLSVDTDHLIEKCKFYDSNQNCSQCESGYYQDNGQCKAINEIIPNCMSYSKDFNCLKCNNGYWLDNISNSCQKLSLQDNCSLYSKLQCLECRPGYVLSTNQVNFIDTRTNLLNQIFLRDLFTSSLSTSLSPQISQCKRSLLTNCVSFSSSDECEECEPNYYLNSDKKCIIVPSDRINNCKIYTSAQICKKCSNNYFLKNNECHQSTIVPNCSIYKDFIDSCDKCFDSYILKNNECNRRIYYPISNCVKYHKINEECEECYSGRRLTDDKLGCFNLIKNCETYHPVYASSALFHSCSVCENGFYPSDDGKFLI